jgi:hypothetical protein
MTERTKTRSAWLREHVGSGQREPFRDSGELLAFFEARQDPQPQEVER